MNGYIQKQRVKKNLHDQRFIQFVVLTLQAVLEDVEHKNTYSVLALKMHFQVFRILIVLLLVVKL